MWQLAVCAEKLFLVFRCFFATTIQDPRTTDAQWRLFHRNPKLLGLGRQLGQLNFRAYGVFSADLSAPIFVQWVPCPFFPFFNHYFYKKLRLYTQIINIFFGLGFKFWSQRIRDLAILVSVVVIWTYANCLFLTLFLSSAQFWRVVFGLLLRTTLLMFSQGAWIALRSTFYSKTFSMPSRDI